MWWRQPHKTLDLSSRICLLRVDYKEIELLTVTILWRFFGITSYMWPPPPRHVVEKLRPLSGNCIAFEEPPRKSSPSSIWYCLIPKWPNYCVWWICLNLWLLICKYLWSWWIRSFWPWHWPIWQRTLIIRSTWSTEHGYACLFYFSYSEL